MNNPDKVESIRGRNDTANYDGKGITKIMVQIYSEVDHEKTFFSFQTVDDISDVGEKRPLRLNVSSTTQTIGSPCKEDENFNAADHTTTTVLRVTVMITTMAEITITVTMRKLQTKIHVPLPLGGHNYVFRYIGPCEKMKFHRLRSFSVTPAAHNVIRNDGDNEKRWQTKKR